MGAVSLEAVMKLHRRNLALHSAGLATIGVGAMQRFRREGLSGRRPSAAQRTEAIALGMEWDAGAHESRGGRPYSDSTDEVNHRLGRNLPAEQNQINDNR